MVYVQLLDQRREMDREKCAGFFGKPIFAPPPPSPFFVGGRDAKVRRNGRKMGRQKTGEGGVVSRGPNFRSVEGSSVVECNKDFKKILHF